MSKNERRYVITNEKVLTETEQGQLIKVCDRTLRQNSEDVRNGLMFLIALECGLRAQELLNLRLRDFDGESHTLFIRSLKGSNPRVLPIKAHRSRDLKKFVLSHFSDNILKNEKDVLIFDISYMRLYQLWDFYRPNPNKTLHCLRHTFAVNFYLRCKDLRAVQLAMGHRNIDNTMVYVDFCYSQDVLRSLMHGKSTLEKLKA